MRALEALRAALFRSRRRQPDSRLEQALALHESGRLEEAETRYRAILRDDARNAPALHLLGVLLHQRGDHAAALEPIRGAIALEGGVALYHYNLGNVLAALGDDEAASESFAHATRLNPGHAAAWFNLGRAHQQRGREQDAIAAYRRSLAVDAGLDAARHELGKLLVAFADKNPGSEDAYKEAIALLQGRWQSGPDPGGARMAFAHALEQTERWGDALEHFSELTAGPSGARAAYCGLGNCCNRMGRMPEAIQAYRKALAAGPADANIASSIVAGLIYDADCSPQALFEEHCAWSRRFAPPPSPAPAGFSGRRNALGRLRIGYVSPDFRRHPVTALFLPVLERHDCEAVETHCYYNFPAHDALTERVKRAAGHWHDIFGLTDEQVAARIREDRIDILVDLAGHTTHGRLLAFAHKPAPVQISWLGYFHSTGLPAMDYFVTDPHSSPGGQERYFVERLVRLPVTRFCYQPLEIMPEPNALPAIGRGSITFGSFNNLAKLNGRVLALWSDILKAVSNSRLIVQALAFNDASTRERFAATLGQCGIPRERVELRPYVPIERSPYAYHDIDIALDPFPFCGGMTSLESLWMGVPVVTLSQEILAGRQTESMLANLGLTEWVARSPERYIEIAAELARDLPRLAEQRRTLRARFAASALADAVSFTRHLEAAYQAIWTESIKGLDSDANVI